MSHPAPDLHAGLAAIVPGEVWENPVTGERAKLIELPWQNPEGRAVAELTALVGARVAGEHRHPGMLESFTVPDGELTVDIRDGEHRSERHGSSSRVENLVSLLKASVDRH